MVGGKEVDVIKSAETRYDFLPVSTDQPRAHVSAIIKFHVQLTFIVSTMAEEKQPAEKGAKNEGKKKIVEKG